MANRKGNTFLIIFQFANKYDTTEKHNRLSPE